MSWTEVFWRFSVVECNSVCSCAYSLWLLHTTPSPGTSVLCRAQGLTRILDICAEDWTGSSKMWLCNGECRVAVEALQEVSTLSTQCYCCPCLWFYVPKNAKHYHAHGWVTFPRNCLNNCVCLGITVLRNHLWLRAPWMTNYMCCLHEGEPRLNGINKWLWN